jgi:signal transduction histidine kinase
MVDFLRQFAEDFESPDKTKAVKVSFVSPEKELEAEVDKPLFHEAMMILCNNSVRFAHDDCVISIGLARTQDGNIQIQVADNGIGIKDEYKANAFEPFANEDGIGLDRVKEIVVAHEGSIDLADNPGGGTIFVITLPPAEEVEEAIMLED